MWMRRITWRTAAVTASLVGGSDVQAQGSSSQPSPDSTSAPIANVSYALTYDRHTAPSRVVGVEMVFTAEGTGPVLLSLPAWTPGAYEISNFSRWVVGFNAWSGDKPLS